MREETILLAVIGPARGLKGEAIVRPYTDRPQERFAVGEILTDEMGNEYEISNYRFIKNRHALTFSGISTRDDIEALRGLKLYGPELEEEDAYREQDLVGFKVLDQNNQLLGVVKGINFHYVQDLLEIEANDGSEVLLPFVYDLVPEINEGSKEIIVDPPAGLFPEVAE